MTLLVWVAALFLPAGAYDVGAEGSPIPGTFRRDPSPLEGWASSQPGRCWSRNATVRCQAFLAAASSYASGWSQSKNQ